MDNSNGINGVFDAQEAKHKRVVTQIKNYPRPSVIFQAITPKEIEYGYVKKFKEDLQLNVGKYGKIVKEETAK